MKLVLEMHGQLSKYAQCIEPLLPVCVMLHHIATDGNGNQSYDTHAHPSILDILGHAILQ